MDLKRVNSLLESIKGPLAKEEISDDILATEDTTYVPFGILNDHIDAVRMNVQDSIEELGGYESGLRRSTSPLAKEMLGKVKPHLDKMKALLKSVSAEIKAMQAVEDEFSSKQSSGLDFEPGY